MFELGYPSRWIRVFLVVLTISLMGCDTGGGGGGKDNENVYIETRIFDISKITSLETGDTLSISLTGIDNSGDSYTGSIQHVVIGPVLFEGLNLIQKTSTTIIDKNGVGTIFSMVSDQYYNTDRTIYKIIFSNGVVATPTNYAWELPTEIPISIYFFGQDLNYSNGDTSQSIWQTSDAGNGNVNIRIDDLVNHGIGVCYQSNWVVSEKGKIVSFEQAISNTPSNGMVTSLVATSITTSP